jgi:peptidoglycan/LPS O-acetylase OafA/YrhL
MKINYRPEIDGLRAIAVVAVVIYHAKFEIFNYQILKGGFIGVDIFFVISGYLITSIILKELTLTKNFSFKYFYERRIRRIIPVLFFVMLTTIPFAYIYLVPSAFLDFSKSILSALIFISNFYFYFNAVQYAGEGASLKPFLHTWSLSVEEQFYILFPIILFILFKYFRKYLRFFLFSGLAFSLLLAEYASRNHPYFNFYLLFTRGWELLIGTVLSYLHTYGRRDVFKNKIFYELLSIFGLILIISSIFIFNDKMFLPSIYTLLPILGVSFIIFSKKTTFITRMLSSKLFVGIGLISYSIYIWHFPIFVFSKIAFPSYQDNFSKFFLLILTFFLSILSYFFIEKKFRDKQIKFGKIKFLIFFTLIILLLVNFYIVIKKGLEYRIPSFLRESEFNQIISKKNEWEKCKLSKIKNNNFCEYGNFNNKVYLIGDSHTIPLVSDLSQSLNKIEYSLITLYEPGNFFLKKSYNENARVNFLKEKKNSVFIFGGYIHLESKENLKDMQKLYLQHFKTFLDNNNTIILIYPIPDVKFEYNMKLINFYKKNNYVVDQYSQKKFFKDSSISAYKLYDYMKFKKIYRIYPENHSCDAKKCYSIKDNIIFISDNNHPSTHFAKKISDDIIKVILEHSSY